MAAWRMARSLEVLRAELDGAYPHRDRRSDGGVGDTSHQARPSKHNPGPDGIVEARDFDEDVKAGSRPLWPFVQYLVRLGRAGTHPALGAGAHIIYEGRIWSHARGWVERPYTGANAHEEHAHVAVADGPGKDSRKAWGVRAALAAPPAGPKPDRWLGLTEPPMVGQDVNNVRHALRVAGNDGVLPSGPYSRPIADLIGVFQRNRQITERGVGPKTWAALRQVVHG